MRGAKTWLYEGGVRSPLIVWGPGLVDPKAMGSVLVTMKIDREYVDKVYYLGPGKGGERAYTLLVAVVLTVAFGANVNSLIQLYIVGVFVSFTLTQAGMVRHWARVRRMRPHPGVRRELFVRRAVALVAFVLCAAVLVVVLGVGDVAILIQDQRVGERADLQQAVPVRVVPRQPGDLQAHDDAGFPEGDFTDQVLEAVA